MGGGGGGVWGGRAGGGGGCKMFQGANHLSYFSQSERHRIILRAKRMKCKLYQHQSNEANSSELRQEVCESRGVRP